MTSISARFGAPLRLAAERMLRSLSRRQAFGLFPDRVAAEFTAICGFWTLALRAKLESLLRGERRRESRLPKRRKQSRTLEREMLPLLDFRHDGFVREKSLLYHTYMCCATRGRAAVDPSFTTRATHADRGSRARIKNYFIQPRPTSEIHDAAATSDASKRRRAFLCVF